MLLDNVQKKLLVEIRNKRNIPKIKIEIYEIIVDTIGDILYIETDFYGFDEAGLCNSIYYHDLNSPDSDKFGPIPSRIIFQAYKHIYNFTKQ